MTNDQFLFFPMLSYSYKNTMGAVARLFFSDPPLTPHATSGATMNSETSRTSEACISLRLPNAHLSRSPATKSLVTPLLAPFPPPSRSNC